jgi:phosphoglycerate kinase
MKKTLADIEPESLRGSTVLVRVDFNVPLEDGRITDDRRIEAAIATLRLLSDAGARVVLLSHLGRPKGRPDPALSLEPVSGRLEELLGQPVLFVPEVTGPLVTERVGELPEGGVALLENTRFVPGDTKNDPELAAEWAALGDLFVNDAFGTAHRAHASTSGLADAMRKKGGEAVAGLLMANEIRFLGDALEDPERPFVAILGGAKVSGKIDVISALLPRVDRLLVGGAMANTFFRAMDLDTGASLVEEDRIGLAKEMLADAGERLVLPIDCVVAEHIEEGAPTRTVAREEVGEGDAIVDIGPRSVSLYGDIIRAARTVVWNGPMGVFEIEAFAKGTLSLARAVAEACDGGALGVVGGGDSGAAAEAAGVAERLTHLSTGGGASLELLAGSTLPGVASLTNRG